MTPIEPIRRVVPVVTLVAWLATVALAAPARAQLTEPPANPVPGAVDLRPNAPDPRPEPRAGAALPRRPGEAVVENFTLFGAPEGAPAPVTVHVNALDLPLSAGTCLTARYEWDFGDPSGAHNRLVGWNAAHVYDRPGEYVVRLLLTDASGRVSRYERTVRVTGSERRPVLFVSADGDDSADGRSPARPLRSISRALAQAGDDTRVMLRRGDRFGVIATLRVRQRGLVLGAYDPPAGRFAPGPVRAALPRPVLVWSGPRNASAMIETHWAAADVTLQDIAFDSAFDRDSEKRGMPIAVRPTGTNLTVRRCTFLNVGDGVNANARPRGVLVQDSVAPLITGVRSYFGWVEGSDIAFVGNVVANSTREAALRVGLTGAERVLIAGNHLTNLDRTGVDRYDIAKNALTVQFGSHVYVSRNVLSGGPAIVGPLGDRDGLRQRAARLRWVAFEDNRVTSHLRLAHGLVHFAARNNRFFADGRAAILVEGYNAEYQRGSADLTIAHNTAFNRDWKGNFIRVGGSVDGLRLLNNLYAARALKPGSDHTAVVYIAGKDLSGITEIRGNVWPVTRPQDYARGGAFYVWPKWSDAQGYLTLDRWLSLPGVRDEAQVDVDVDEALRPVGTDAARLGRPGVPGVGRDVAGRPRAPDAATVGAWQQTP